VFAVRRKIAADYFRDNDSAAGDSSVRSLCRLFSISLARDDITLSRTETLSDSRQIDLHGRHISERRSIKSWIALDRDRDPISSIGVSRNRY